MRVNLHVQQDHTRLTMSGEAAISAHLCVASLDQSLSQALCPLCTVCCCHPHTGEQVLVLVDALELDLHVPADHDMCRATAEVDADIC